MHAHAHLPNKLVPCLQVEDAELLRHAATVMPLQQLREAAAQQLALQQQLQPLPADPLQSFIGTTAVPPGFTSPAAPAVGASSGSGSSSAKGPARPQLGVEDLLVKGLLAWFKNSFFTWVREAGVQECCWWALHSAV
jgi:hypothetical protein